MNIATLIGRLTKDTELRTTTGGKSVCNFTLAVDRRFKAEGRPDADFFNIIVWGKSGENCAKYLAKGSQVCIVGEIQNRSYDDKDGNKRYITEIIADRVQFLGSKGTTSKPQDNEYDEPTNPPTDDDENQDLPF